jgi:hypothetical protein
MAHGNNYHRVHGGTEESSDSYYSHTPPHIQEELDLVEDNARVLRRFVSDDEVLKYISSWIIDIGNFSSRVTQYFKTMVIYWKMKLLLEQYLKECKEEKN